MGAIGFSLSAPSDGNGAVTGARPGLFAPPRYFFDDE
jgi:hypothetical protein